jgi:hypothetical protein
MLKKAKILLLGTIITLLNIGFTPNQALANHNPLHGDCTAVSEIDTAIGCIPTDSNSGTTDFIVRWSIGLGGGIAFLLILFAAFRIMTSAGDPKKLQSGQELLGSAISGILFIIFSVFLIRMISIDILGIFSP